MSVLLNPSDLDRIESFMPAPPTTLLGKLARPSLELSRFDRAKVEMISELKIPAVYWLATPVICDKDVSFLVAIREVLRRYQSRLRNYKEGMVTSEEGNGGGKIHKVIEDGLKNLPGCIERWEKIYELWIGAIRKKYGV